MKKQGLCGATVRVGVNTVRWRPGGRLLAGYPVPLVRTARRRLVYT